MAVKNFLKGAMITITDEVIGLTFKDDHLLDSLHYMMAGATLPSRFDNHDLLLESAGPAISPSPVWEFNYEQWKKTYEAPYVDPGPPPEITLLSVNQQITDLEDRGSLIFDWEVWVTPYGKYLHMPTELSVDDVIYANVWKELGTPSPRYNHTEKTHGGVYSDTYVLFDMITMGKQIVEAFERHGFFVRLQEVSKPRFGETFWMQTNGITAAE